MSTGLKLNWRVAEYFFQKVQLKPTQVLPTIFNFLDLILNFWQPFWCCWKFFWNMSLKFFIIAVKCLFYVEKYFPSGTCRKFFIEFYSGIKNLIWTAKLRFSRTSHACTNQINFWTPTLYSKGNFVYNVK